MILMLFLYALLAVGLSEVLEVERNHVVFDFETAERAAWAHSAIKRTVFQTWPNSSTVVPRYVVHTVEPPWPGRRISAHVKVHVCTDVVPHLGDCPSGFRIDSWVIGRHEQRDVEAIPVPGLCNKPLRLIRIEVAAPNPTSNPANPVPNRSRPNPGFHRIHRTVHP